MLALGAATRIYLAVGATDMRKGFDGLLGLVQQRLQADPLSGHLFLFCNRPRTRLKALYWDGSGLWVMIKRLEQGTFAWPKPGRVDGVKLRLAPEAFAMLTDGIDLRGARMRPWYERE